MEFNDEFGDLVVWLDRSSDEDYEVLEDLITIEDEGIMDISHKLQQRDFDEYVGSLQKDVNILPQSFCRIKQNIKLLDSCRPLSIQVVDCKKFKIFYNDKLVVDLKTRESLDDKFKEILSNKDSDISDDDTIEIDVDVAGDDDMEDLIRFDYVQENQVDIDDLSQTQKINDDIECTDKSKVYNKEIYLHKDTKSNEIHNITKSTEDDSMNKSKNYNTSNILKVCEDVNCKPISLKSTFNTIIPHCHSRADEKLKFAPSKITNLGNARDDNIYNTNVINNVTYQSEDISSANNSFLTNYQKVSRKQGANQIEVVDCRRESEISKKYKTSETKSKQYKNKNKSQDKSKTSGKKINKHLSNHTKSIELQKKIADMLVTVEGLKNSYSKKSSKKSEDPLSLSYELTQRRMEWNNYNLYQAQENNTNSMPNYYYNSTRPQIYGWHQESCINRYAVPNMNINNSILSRSNLYKDMSSHFQKQAYGNIINNAFMLSSKQFSTNDNLYGRIHNNNCNNFPNKNSEKSILSKSLASINFMKPHLQKLAKAQENPKSIKIRPIHNYGLSNNQQGIEKTTIHDNSFVDTIQNTTAPAKNNSKDNASLKKMREYRKPSHETNLSNSMFTSKHPTVVKILKDGMAVPKDIKAHNVPEQNINKSLVNQLVQGGIDTVVPFHPKEIQEFQQKILFCQNNEIPQQIPTLQNRKIIEPTKVLSKPNQDSMLEYPRRESKIKNLLEPWRIPLIKKTEKATYQLPVKGDKMDVDIQKKSPKLNDNSGQNTKNIDEVRVKKEDVKKEIKETIEEKNVKPTPAPIKLTTASQSPKYTSMSTYQSPIQCVQVETHQESPKVKKTIKEDEAKLEVGKKEEYVKTTSSPKAPGMNITELSPKNVDPKKLNSVDERRTSPSLTKVTKKEYSPPVLPIPTFKHTFEMLAKLNLISKYKYRRSRNTLKYVMIDQEKILSNRSLTKDLEKYFRTKGDS